MRVRSVKREDLPDIFEITHRAFEKDELFGQYGYVIVTEEGDCDWSGKPEVAGFVFLHRTAGDEASKKWRADTLFKKFERKLLDWEIRYDTKFLNRVEDPKRLAEYIKLEPWNAFKAINPRWHMGLICVSPKFQRRGVGSMLVHQVQKLAADEGLPVTLEASIVGRFLYLKSGFKIVGEVKLCEEYTDALMLWEPSGLEGRWLEDYEGDKANMKKR